MPRRKFRWWKLLIVVVAAACIVVTFRSAGATNAIVPLQNEIRAGSYVNMSGSAFNSTGPFHGSPPPPEKFHLYTTYTVSAVNRGSFNETVSMEELNVFTLKSTYFSSNFTVPFDSAPYSVVYYIFPYINVTNASAFLSYLTYSNQAYLVLSKNMSQGSWPYKGTSYHVFIATFGIVPNVTNVNRSYEFFLTYVFGARSGIVFLMETDYPPQPAQNISTWSSETEQLSSTNMLAGNTAQEVLLYGGLAAVGAVGAVGIFYFIRRTRSRKT